MPINPYDPVLEGLQTGYGIADRIRQAALQEQEYQRRVREDAWQQENQKYTRERQQKMDALDELKMRLGLATSPELQEVSAGAVTRPVEAQMPEAAQPAAGSGAARIMQSMTGPNYTLPIQMPVEAPIEYGGRRYAVRGREELWGDELRKAELLGNQRLHETAALERLRNPDITIPGIIDTPVPRSVAPSLITAAQRAQDRKQRAATGEETRKARAEEGRLNRQNRLDAAVRRQAAGGTGGGTAGSTADTRVREQAKRTELQKLEAEEVKLQEDVVNLRSGLGEDGKPLTADQAPGAVARVSLKQRRLKQIRKRKVELGFTTPEDAGLTSQTAKAKPDPLGVR